MQTIENEFERVDSRKYHIRSEADVTGSLGERSISGEKSPTSRHKALRSLDRRSIVVSKRTNANNTKVHTVKATLQVLDLSRAGSGLELAIYAENQKIGRVIIGRGSLTWYGKKRKYGRRIDWSRLAEWLDNY